jgi:hypothetical protein
MKGNRRVRRVKVSADGTGVVSHAGVGLLREMAEYTGQVDGVTQALIGTYRGVPLHAPGRVSTTPEPGRRLRTSGGGSLSVGLAIMLGMVNPARQQDHQPRGAALLPRDLAPAELAAAPSLSSFDVPLIPDLTDAEDEAFAAAIRS